MFTLATSRPTLTELVPIPPLEITGRALPRYVHYFKRFQLEKLNR